MTCITYKEFKIFFDTDEKYNTFLNKIDRARSISALSYYTCPKCDYEARR